MRRPSAGPIIGWLRRRLRDLRYLFGDLVYTIARALRAIGGLIGPAFRAVAGLIRAIGSGAAGFWRALSVVARRRLLAAIVAAAAALALIEFAVPALPCQFPAGDRCPPADDAAEIVPADSLAYIHLNLDPETEQYENLAALAARVPLFSQQIATRGLVLVPGPAGGAPDFARDIDPWFAGEAAVSVLGEPGAAAEQVLLLEVEDKEGVDEYAESVSAGSAATEEYRGVEITSDQRDLATARIEDFLVIGSVDGLRAIIDTATGAEGAAPLAEDEVAERVRDELPDHRFLEAWVSTAGATEIVGGDRGTLGSLAPLISPGTTSGAAVSVSAGTESLELAVRSALDPEREKSSPGFFAAFPSFEPELPEKLSAESLAYLGVGEPRKAVSALLDQAVAQAPGIASGFADLVEQLRSRGDVDIEKQLLPALGDEAAVAVGPAAPAVPAADPAAPGSEAEEAGGTSGIPGGTSGIPGETLGIPFLEFVADGVDEDPARRALAALLGAVADEVDSGGLGAPQFEDVEVAGVEARSLRLTPAVELTFAVFDGLVALATSPAGIAQLADPKDGLDGNEDYERATEDFPDQVSLLAFFDLRALIAEGFEIGLAQVPAFNTFADDFRRLEALGLAITTEDDLLSTDARLLLGESGDEALTSPRDD